MAGKTDLAPDPTAIGEVSSPPFVQLPDPSDQFFRRSARFRLLGMASPLKPYLDFAAALTEAQIAVLTGLEGDSSVNDAVIARAHEFGMPSIDRDKATSDKGLDQIFERLFAEAEKIEKPQNATEALERVRGMQADDRRVMAGAVFAGILPPDAIAEHIYIWAGLQVHFSRLAAALDPKAVRPVADGVCPVCGSLPSSSAVVGWKGAHGARFCCCSLCSTLWHYVRIKCVCCGSTKGIGYKEVEDGGGFIKAETCDECQSWVKIIYQQHAPDADPVADDVASLGIDMLMRETAYRRGGFAPLLAGL
ncbi:formate dehydrogenase accessory protein FdhE [Ochrobactrum sp. CM-21-5]|nr:formate dehydrogenase accessory protein FdhE [Ochrobactrum sp. CM-21-5]MBC2887221.1 formate dehydrogenase accessory protein FdhE [Ochrobactrum sp. CM-21-5]